MGTNQMHRSDWPWSLCGSWKLIRWRGCEWPFTLYQAASNSQIKYPPAEFLSALNLVQVKQLFTCKMLNICADLNCQAVGNGAFTKPCPAINKCIARGPKKTQMRRGGFAASAVGYPEKCALCHCIPLAFASSVRSVCVSTRCETWIFVRTSEIFVSDVNNINKFFVKFFPCLAFQRRADESQVSEASYSQHYTSQTLIKKHQNNNNIFFLLLLGGKKKIWIQLFWIIRFYRNYIGLRFYFLLGATFHKAKWNWNNRNTEGRK